MTHNKRGSPRRGLPLFPTLMTAIVALILGGFGIWQLQRMAWKAEVLEKLAAAADKPLIDLGVAPLPDDLQFRHVRLVVSCPEQEPYGKIGYGPDGRTGYSAVVRCRAGDEVIEVDTGWGPRPDSWKQVDAPWPDALPVTGTLIDPGRDGVRYQLVADTAPAPLLPSTPPGIENIPNNHFAYAIQWFGFAGMLIVIWGVYVYRWRSVGNLALPSGED